MGYTHDTHMSQFIPPGAIQKSAGTWTPTLASNVYTDNRTAAAAGFNLFVPIVIPGNSLALKGARLKSVELIWSNGTADLTSMTTVELEKATVSSAGAVSGEALTVTIDAANDTDGERVTQGNHRMLMTLSAPQWVDNDCAYSLYVAVVAAAGSVFKLYGAVANFDLRV